MIKSVEILRGRCTKSIVEKHYLPYGWMLLPFCKEGVFWIKQIFFIGSETLRSWRQRIGICPISLRLVFRFEGYLTFTTGTD